MTGRVIMGSLVGVLGYILCEPYVGGVWALLISVGLWSWAVMTA